VRRAAAVAGTMAVVAVVLTAAAVAVIPEADTGTASLIGDGDARPRFFEAA
jgi:hypothetical protein